MTAKNPSPSNIGATRDQSSGEFAHSEPYQLSLSDLVRTLWRSKWLIGLSIFLTSGVFIIASYLVSPRYRATLLMIPNQEDMQQSSLANLSQQLGFSGLVPQISGSVDYSSEALELLQSRVFIEAFIREENLIEDLNKTASIRQSIARMWMMFDRNNHEDIDTQEVKISSAYEVFLDDILSVYEDPMSNTIQLSITWTDRKAAAEWANLLFWRLNEKMRERSRSQSEGRIRALTNELELRRIEVIRTAIYELIEIEISKIVKANSSDEYIFRIIDPAHAPSPYDRHFPDRTVWLISGSILGFVLGSLVSVIRLRFRIGS